MLLSMFHEFGDVTLVSQLGEVVPVLFVEGATKFSQIGKHIEDFLLEDFPEYAQQLRSIVGDVELYVFLGSEI